MAAAFDSTASNIVVGGTSVPSFNINLVSGSNMAVAVGLMFLGNATTAITVTVGGTSATLVSGTDTTTDRSHRSMIFVVAKGTATGNQSVAVSWTTAADCIAAAVGASGVDQSTPMNNGTWASGASTTPSVTITSASGDLTLDTASCSFGKALSAPTQTQRWDIDNNNVNGAGSTGPGTASPTHSWTMAPSDGWTDSGANFVQSSGATTTYVAPASALGRSAMIGLRYV